MQKTALALHWLVLLTVLAIQLLGIASSIGTTIPLRLTNGTSVEVSVFRLHPAPLHFRLDFNKQRGEIRPELGEMRRTAPERGSIRFDNPGESIKLLVTNEKGQQLYEMFPGGYVIGEKEDTRAKRKFEPFVEDSNPAAYPWPPANHLRPILPAGFSTLKFSIVNVGNNTANEQVMLFIDPPIGPKAVHTLDYMWLSWATILWPFNLFALGIYGWYLVRKIRQPGSKC